MDEKDMVYGCLFCSLKFKIDDLSKYSEQQAFFAKRICPECTKKLKSVAPL